jgi:hypothetical protein
VQTVLPSADIVAAPVIVCNFSGGITMASDRLISVYAAIVSTSALLLNFKNWLDSGAKLKLTLMDNAKMFGGGAAQKSPDGQIALIVTNQGSAATTFTHLVMLEFPSLLRRLRIRNERTAIVPSPQLPGYPSNIPGELAPAHHWFGMSNDRALTYPDARNGKFYLGIYATNRDRPYLIKIPPAKPAKQQAVERAS